jgi:hypothetical protein
VRLLVLVLSAPHAGRDRSAARAQLAATVLHLASLIVLFSSFETHTLLDVRGAGEMFA